MHYDYRGDNTNVNSQRHIQAIIVGYKTGGASIMPSLPSPTNTSYPSPIDSSNLEQPEKG